MEITRTNSKHMDFVSLVKLLDAELAQADGADHQFYVQFNTIEKLNHAVLVHCDGEACACGAIKALDNETMEVKRMYVIQNKRNQGLASMVLEELENWSREMAYKRCVLETGKKQSGAKELYLKSGFKIIPNYGQYIGIENSICFEKML